MNVAFWGAYAGNNKSYDKHCPSENKNLTCFHAKETGEITEENVFNHINYINADPLIYQNAYLSGGGAHSDIYRKQHGKLMWHLISSTKE